MIPARQAVQRPAGARLLHIGADGRLRHGRRAALADHLRRGDLVIANDAATLPASLHGTHVPSGGTVEVRLAGGMVFGSTDAASACPEAGAGSGAESIPGRRFVAVVFGAGDWRARTEDRPLPPPLSQGDALRLGPLTAIVEARLGHPRLVALRFEGTPAAFWDGLARHGRPVQYAHLRDALALWDTWTPLAGPPVAFEPPSAGFALDWDLLRTLRAKGVGFATLTHSAGLSSTGDVALDARLPFDEPYRIPAVTARALASARGRGSRVIAIGTTVVRALEHAARGDGAVRAGDGIADQRVGPHTRLRVVDAILSGTHERRTSHYELLRAFADDDVLSRAAGELEERGYTTHEFGDSVLVENRWGQVRLISGNGNQSNLTPLNASPLAPAQTIA